MSNKFCKICLALESYAKHSPLLQQSNYLTFLEWLPTSCQLSVFCYQTAESHRGGWQSPAFRRAHTSHSYPQDTLFVGRISMLEIRNSNQLLKSICHSHKKNLSYHLWSCHTGWICQRDISPVSFFMHLRGFLDNHTYAHTHTKKSISSNLTPRQVPEER